VVVGAAVVVACSVVATSVVAVTSVGTTSVTGADVADAVPVDGDPSVAGPSVDTVEAIDVGLDVELDVEFDGGWPLDESEALVVDEVVVLDAASSEAHASTVAAATAIPMSDIRVRRFIAHGGCGVMSPVTSPVSHV
jgi:hypothetical protein